MGNTPSADGVELVALLDFETAFGGSSSFDIALAPEAPTLLPQGEVNLLCAVAESAAVSLRKPEFNKDGSINHEARRERLRARKWFDGKTEIDGVSFSELCELLGGDAAYIRRRLYTELVQADEQRKRQILDQQTLLAALAARKKKRPRKAASRAAAPKPRLRARGKTARPTKPASRKKRR